MTVPTEIRTSTAPAVNVDHETLKYLGYDPSKVATKALVLLAMRYELDPLLGEIQLIDKGDGARLYVTRDGMLAVAHRSGVLDGITVDQQRRNTTDDGWSAYVSVWRKDMGHPFTYGAQCKDSEPQAKAGKGPEMALARAERRALKRAFQIRTDFNPERPNEDIDLGDGGELDVEVGRVRMLDGAVPDDPPLQEKTRAAIKAQLDAEAALTVASKLERFTRGEWVPDNRDQADAHRAVANMKVGDRTAFLKRHGIEDFGTTWSPEAVAEVLAGSPDAVDTGRGAQPVESEGK